MARYVVDVMPKREILDPQGKAVLGALPRLGFEGVHDVRRMAETLLANPVIEDFTVTSVPGETTEDAQ